MLIIYVKLLNSNYLAKILLMLYNLNGDSMKNKEEAVKLIKKKLAKQTFYSYKEIAEVTGYHPKYILKLKDEIINGSISLEHGNKNRKPINAISEEEKTKIINLYKRSNASIRRFCKFYGSRSYSCVYNVIKEYEEKMKEGTYENKNNNN